MKILVVDDMEDARELMEAALLSAGYDDLVSVASAAEALNMLKVGHAAAELPGVDLLLLDVVMPQPDGIETCRLIRSDPRYAEIPIIMVTTRDDVDSLAKAFVAGATDYITKPLSRVELVARVGTALKLKAELDRRQERERELLAFVSRWGERRATLWIDQATGLFVGEVAEAYLTATARSRDDELVSIVALELDRFDMYRTAHGEAASQSLLARVAQVVRGLGATVGTIAAAYRNGLMIFVAPNFGAATASTLGETLRSTISGLNPPDAEPSASDRVTASVAAVTGRVRQGIDGAQLLTRAISTVQDVAASGGNRVLALTI